MWGLIDYQLAHERQLQYVEELRQGKRSETTIICSHPPTVTLGKKSTEADVTSWQGAIYNVERGGKATYHGPEQLVVYPILNLSNRNRDVHAMLRGLENVCIDSLSHYGIEARGDNDNTGVWVGQQKVASIGLAIKRWITYHGMAINIGQDEMAFTGIQPCGFSTATMTSLSQVLGRVVDKEDVVKHLQKSIQKHLSS